MAESKHLCAELGEGAGADQDEVDHEEDQLVDKAEKHAGERARRHDDPGSPAGWPSAGVYPWPPSEVPNRTDASWCTAHDRVDAEGERPD